MAVIYKGETRLLSGLADYSLSCKGSNSKTQDTNFVIVQAKHQYCPDLGLPELAAYMEIIHTTRKEDSKHDCVVFGMVSDGIVFRFCQIVYLQKVNPSIGVVRITRKRYTRIFYPL